MYLPEKALIILLSKKLWFISSEKKLNINENCMQLLREAKSFLFAHLNQTWNEFAFG
jgi:hypothetical protein